MIMRRNGWLYSKKNTDYACQAQYIKYHTTPSIHPQWPNHLFAIIYQFF